MPPIPKPSQSTSLASKLQSKTSGSNSPKSEPLTLVERIKKQVKPSPALQDTFKYGSKTETPVDLAAIAILVEDMKRRVEEQAQTCVQLEKLVKKLLRDQKELGGWVEDVRKEQWDNAPF